MPWSVLWPQTILKRKEEKDSCRVEHQQSTEYANYKEVFDSKDALVREFWMCGADIIAKA
eukprot:4951772-Amphidinium_carterae.1